MADPERDKRWPEKRWYEHFFDDGSTELSAGDPGRAYYEQLRDGAKAAGSAANALANGAYSTLGNSYDAVRAVARGVGLLGPEEFRRFGQEADFIGASLGQIGPALGQIGPALGQIVDHPRLAARAAGRALKEEPLLPFYLGGRLGMGVITGLGPTAMAGGLLRAVEDGHNLVDAIAYPGIQGRPPPGGLLGIPPEGRGLLGIPTQDPR